MPSTEEQRATWQDRMNERLFVFENGGWVVVDGWRRRMGPKEGEVWVTYDEMQRDEAHRPGAGMSSRDGLPHSQGNWPATTRPCITTASGLTRWMA